LFRLGEPVREDPVKDGARSLCPEFALRELAAETQHSRLPAGECDNLVVAA
jgi:hypothetical protein